MHFNKKNQQHQTVRTPESIHFIKVFSVKEENKKLQYMSKLTKEHLVI